MGTIRSVSTPPAQSDAGGSAGNVFRLAMQRPRALVLETCVVASLAAVVAALFLHVGTASWREPFDYDGDALQAQSIVRGIIETGWVNHSPRLGAPFGQLHFDFPLGGDNLNFAVIRFLSLFSDDWALVTNLYFLLGFPAAAATSHVALRWLRAPRWSAASASLLFAFAPYHFFRGEEHLFLATYAIVPIAVLLIVRACGGTLPWTPSAATAGSSKVRSVARSWPWLVGLAAVGASGAYYFIFSVMLFIVAGSIAAAVCRSTKPLVAALASIGLAATSFAVGMVPSWWYWRANDRVAVAKRSPFEQDYYGLRISSLLSPVQHHVFPPFRYVAERLVNPVASFSSHESYQYLGLVGAVGLVMMVSTLLVRAVAPVRQQHAVRGLLSALVVLCIAVSAIGGLSWAGAVVSFTQIRAWSRISIFISFMVLAWMAIGMVRLETRMATAERSRRWRGALVLGAVTVLGLFDQVPTMRFPLAWSNTSVNVQSDREYFQRVERTLGAGASVFVLPVRRYPEEQATNYSADYDLMRPYLSSETLCWSYGGMKFRESEWQQLLIGIPVPQLLDDLVAVGFDAVLVDRFGYPDGGASLEQQISAAVPGRASTDATGRWVTFDLSDYALWRTVDLGAASLDRRRAALLGPAASLVRDCRTGELVTG